jgi:hypothetical protein
MTPAPSRNTGQNRPKTANQRREREQYEPEIMYQYWAAAGGKVLEAIRLAEDAGEDRVPSKRHTWAEYAVKHNFAERLKEEERQQWQQFHEQRAENQQRVLDQIAEAFEQLGAAFSKTILRDIAALHSGDTQAYKQAQRRLDKLFGSIDGIERFFRMYLRARDLPERLTQQTMKVSPNVIGLEELQEDDDWASSAEEARRKTEDE